LATHGEFPDESAANAHALWLADEGGHSVALSAADVRTLVLPAARLVVLSICNGGLYRIGPSDEPYGLMPVTRPPGSGPV
jgi:CHAT domain-containing protein